jgi:hypothetical protein
MGSSRLLAATFSSLCAVMKQSREIREKNAFSLLPH